MPDSSAPRPDITETPKFQAWFSGSKAVDPQGHPLRCYHGTGMTFKKFDPARAGLAQGPQSNKGLWFSSSTAVADDYAEGSVGNTMLPRNLQKKQAPQVYPVYLKTVNPLVVNNNMTTENAFRKAKEDGNDGIVFRNADEGGERADTYVVFRSDQVQSALSPRFAAALDTPAFKSWFQGSQVVDSEGQPLRVFHGTAHDFDTFDMAKQNGNYGGRFQGREGFFFTNSPDEASDVADWSDIYKNPIGATGSHGANIMPVYLSIKNPYVRKSGGQWTQIWYDNNWEDLQAKCKKAGHDGIIIVGTGKASGYAMYVVFSANQIKSATGNNGAFDPSDARMTASAKTAGEDPTRRRMIVQGLPVAIEYPAGSTKLGEDDNGKKWARVYLLDYGFIEGGPLSTDGETMDVYVGPSRSALQVYVVNQLKKDGSLDEHKCMLGFDSLEDARRGYLMHYPEGWEKDRVGSIKTMGIAEFRKWLGSNGVAKAASSGQVRKIRSIKTDEGTFSVWDVDADHRRADMFTVWEHPDGWIVRNVLIPDNMQHRGVATGTYQKLNQLSLKATGHPLRSTQARTLLDGKQVLELSDQGRAMWDSFTRKGMAEATGDTYKFKTAAAPTLDPTEFPAFKAWFGDSKVVDTSGQPVVVYHGTDKKFRSFNPKLTTQGIIWFTNDRSAIEAGEVGAAGKGVILEMYAKISNPAGWKEYDQLGLYEFKHRGYDGAILPEKDGTFTGFVFDPAQLKSIKNKGTWDPANKALMAGRTARAIPLPSGAVGQILSILLDTILHHPPKGYQRALLDGPEESKDWLNPAGRHVHAHPEWYDNGPIKLELEYVKFPKRKVGQFVVQGSLHDEGSAPPTITITLDLHCLYMVWDEQDTYKLRQELRSVVYHELTHLLDPKRHEFGTDRPTYAQGGPEYFNAPNEVRAFLQMIIKEVEDHLGLQRLPGVLPMEQLLMHSATWKRYNRHWSQDNRRYLIRNTALAVDDYLVRWAERKKKLNTGSATA